MNGIEYKNIIDWTLKHENLEFADTLEKARAIFKNLGVALPQGNLAQIAKILKTNDYMGWTSCTVEEAQEAANNGVAAIGINDEKIVILSAKAETDEDYALTSAGINDIIRVVDEETPTLITDAYQFYAYSNATTTNNNSGSDFDNEDVYTKLFRTRFKFTSEAAELIRLLHGKISRVYSTESTMKKAWRCARGCFQCFHMTTGNGTTSAENLFH